MDLYKYLGKNVKIDFGDEVIYGKVIGHTSALDNEEPDDDGNGVGENINVRVVEPAKRLKVGKEFVALLSEIKEIEVIN